MPTERRDNPRRLAIIRDANGLLVVLTGYAGGDLAEELRAISAKRCFSPIWKSSPTASTSSRQLKKPRPAKQKEIDQTELALLERVAAALEQASRPPPSASRTTRKRRSAASSS